MSSSKTFVCTHVLPESAPPKEILPSPISRGPSTTSARAIGSIFCRHKDERFFDNPETFKWDRFLGHIEENAINEDGRMFSREVLPRNFFAFGGGQQQCPGRKLALMTIKNVVSRFLLDFEQVELATQEKGCSSPLTPIPVCKADHSIYGVGMFRPSEDVRVRIKTKKQQKEQWVCQLDCRSQQRQKNL